MIVTAKSQSPALASPAPAEADRDSLSRRSPQGVDQSRKNAAASTVEFCGTSKSFNGIAAVNEVSLRIEAGEFVSLLGPSGSGKSTLLMLLAGFEEPTAGHVLIDGKPMERVPPNRRDLGIVFQSYALFPRMTVRENVAFPLVARGFSKAQQSGMVAEALERVRMGSFADRLPSQLSGGQQQRVALARALAFRPPLILMDESLSALDRRLRQDMHVELREIHRQVGTTIVFVTHDQEEALALSDRVAVMRDGHVEQVGTPAEVYTRPINEYVARFMGEGNFVKGTLSAADGGQPAIVTELGAIPLIASTARVNAEATVMVRPAAVQVEPFDTPMPADAMEACRVPGQITYASFRGDFHRYHILCGAQLLMADVPSTLHGKAFDLGEPVYATIPKSSVLLLN